ncbi:DUF255 domain-containing protein [bacterium]|nr:MAG: DUF255 domain-containing protein [bacterium]
MNVSRAGVGIPMKRHTLPLLALAGAAVAFAQGGSGLLASFQTSLNSAKTLHADYTYQKVGGVGEAYSVDLKKPDQARVDTPQFTYVADGKTLTTFVKSDKTFYKKPQTKEELVGLFDTDALKTWKGFFAGVPMPTKTRDLGSVERAGTSLKGVEATNSAQSTSRYYLAADNLPRQAEFELTTQAGRDLNILNATSVTSNGEIPGSTFNFTAPAGSKEISADEANADKWLTNLEEAKKIAKSTNRQIFVDFMAEWCGPCKLLAKEVFPTKEFKALGKKLVFLQIDVDKQPAVSKAYKIEAMPTQMVLNKDGGIVGSTVGYGGKQPFFDWLKPLAK